jgi:hypothetical protein
MQSATRARSGAGGRDCSKKPSIPAAISGDRASQRREFICEGNAERLFRFYGVREHSTAFQILPYLMTLDKE